jgi:hypothetical protein
MLPFFGGWDLDAPSCKNEILSNFMKKVFPCQFGIEVHKKVQI